MREEVFNVILGTVNTIRGTAVLHNTTMASAPMVNKNSFEDMLAEEANITVSCQPKHVTFLDTMGGGVTSSMPQRYQEEVVLHQDPPNTTTLRKLDFMQLPENLERCGSPKLGS